jgi:alpha-beta hydrolase superfamily lysophospholipase
MPAFSLGPAFSLLAAFGRVSPDRPLRTWLRTTGYRLRPPRAVAWNPTVRDAQDRLLGSGGAGVHQLATVLHEQRRGHTPTIVLGGFVPDATEQVFLLRGFLLRHGSVYYVNYPRTGFSADLLFAQLDDLVRELASHHGTPPVIFAVSFGAGLALEWLKRARRAGRQPDLRGIVLVSPVACVEDLLAPGDAKPATLLGRAIKPYLGDSGRLDEAAVEKSRVIFARMFEAGAQNKAALATLMTRDELRHLHQAVMATIRGIAVTGARERIQALAHMEAPSSYFSQTLLPLTDAPALVLFAEKEEAVITSHSPTHFAFRTAHRAYFPRSTCKTVVNHRGSPVQHASLIFHCFNFLPPVSAFYRGLKTRKLLRAA